LSAIYFTNYYACIFLRSITGFKSDSEKSRDGIIPQEMLIACGVLTQQGNNSHEMFAVLAL
jgi:hypothetical protein